jgi:putative intracellular protease/amidase
MRVVILLPTGVTVFEALGPYGVFNRLPDAQLRLLGDRSGPVPGHGSKVALVAEASYLFVEPTEVADVLIVPGGLGIQGLVADRTVLDWLRVAQATARWTVAISTGSVLLSAAGVLDGREATTHWLATELLQQGGAHPVNERIVRSGNVLTAAGAVTGLEAALFVVGDLEGQATADRIRADLDEQITVDLSANRPVAPGVLSGLSGAEACPGATVPFAVEAAGRASRRPRRRPWPRGRRSRSRDVPTRSGRSRRGSWRPRSGRIVVADASPSARRISPRR